jgi:DNA repair exonuclease SbcCD ATPase subunit
VRARIAQSDLAARQEELRQASEERIQSVEQVGSLRSELEAARGALARARESADTAAREQAGALASLGEKLRAQLAARDDQLASEREAHAAALQQQVGQLLRQFIHSLTHSLNVHAVRRPASQHHSRIYAATRTLFFPYGVVGSYSPALHRTRQACSTSGREPRWTRRWPPAAKNTPRRCVQ